MRDTVTKGQLIFVQSYFDYLRLRKFFREQDTEVALASEYEDKRCVAAVRP